MSRANYNEDPENDWGLIMWRGAVASAIRGRRGQQFFKDLLAALDAMPAKRLIAKELEASGEVCAIGCLGRQRGIDMSGIDPEDSATVAGTFNIADALAREVVFENDEGTFRDETPEQRYERMRAWVASQIRALSPEQPR